MAVSGCKNQSSFDNGFDPRASKDPEPVPASTQAWDFSNPADYLFDTDHIDMSGSQASLKTVNTTFSDATTFNQGTHSGSIYDGSALTIDMTNTHLTQLDSTWAPYWGNLVAYWTFEGSFNDSLGLQGTPTISASPPTFTAGQVGAQAATFNSASTQNLIFPDNSNLDNSNKMSFSFWFNATTNDGTARGVMCKRVVADTQASYCFFLYTGFALHADIMGSSNRFATNTVFNTKRWYHVVYTYDGTQTAANRVRVYVDGKLDKVAPESSATMTDNASTLEIGHMQSGGYFNGRIDDVAIWRGATLSDADVKILYNRQKSKYAATYDSPLIDVGAPGSWSKLKPVTPLPFHKELPVGAGSETTDYSSATAGLLTSLTAYWSFDESALNGAPAGTDFADNSGHGHDGTETGGVTPAQPGMLDRAAVFDGVDDTVSVGNLGDFSGGFTVGGWVQTFGANSLAATQLVISQRSSVNNYDMQISMTSNLTQFKCYFENATVVSTVSATIAGGIVPGAWYHVMCVFDAVAKTLTPIINGVPYTGVSTGANVPPTGGVTFLGSNNGSAGYWRGALDEIATWTRPLSNAEIIQLYRRGANRVRYQVRSCSDSPCTAGWIGPDGTATTFFSELQNNTSVDASGHPTGTVNSSKLKLDWSGSFFTVAARPVANRYFQYRVYLESDDVGNLCSGAPCIPSVTAIGINPSDRYWGGGAPIVNVTPLSFTQLQTMTRSESGDCTRYQISIDGGSTFKWWNSAHGAWETAGDDVTKTNAASDLTTAHLNLLSAGSYKFRAYLTTNTAVDFTQSCSLSDVEVTYTP